MKKNPNELIIRAIKVRQKEIYAESIEFMAKLATCEDFVPAFFLATQIAKRAHNIVRLQKIAEELTPKPKLKPGGMVPKGKFETMITPTGKEIKVPVFEKLYIKNPLKKQ